MGGLPLFFGVTWAPMSPLLAEDRLGRVAAAVSVTVRPLLRRPFFATEVAAVAVSRPAWDALRLGRAMMVAFVVLFVVDGDRVGE